MLAAVETVNAQPPKRAQLIFGVIQTLHKFKHRSPCPAGLSHRTLHLDQRRGKRGIEKHLAARVSARAVLYRGERAFDAPAALPPPSATADSTKAPQ
jgi:hypothetical protein